MRPQPLTVLKGGINRLRTKGAARADSLYDLVNGQLTAAGTVAARPGTFNIATLPADTKGLVAFNGTLHVFNHEIVSVPDGYTLHVLTSPNATAASPIKISKIRFAAPFLGFLYVVALFEDDTTFHFWLSSSGTWTANTAYNVGDIVTPTTPNGLAYQATRIGSPYPSWAPGVLRTEGDVIEPTVFNNYYYTVTGTLGTNPHSGTTEPTWPTSDGATVTEDGSGLLPQTATATPQPVGSAVPSSVTERYG